MSDTSTENKPTKKVSLKKQLLNTLFGLLVGLFVLAPMYRIGDQVIGHPHMDAKICILLAEVAYWFA
jgi:hypothetical protein